MEDSMLTMRQLRDAGRYEEALEMHYEMMESGSAKATVKQRANDFNYLSVILCELQRWADAESAAREAICLLDGRTDVKGYDETLGCYKAVLAEALLRQHKYDEGLKVKEESIAHYSIFHNPPDDFLNRMVKQYKQMKMWVRKMKEDQQSSAPDDA